MKLYRAIVKENGANVMVTWNDDVEKYFLYVWHSDSGERIMEMFYKMEQEDESNNYFDERERFLEDWKEDAYIPSGLLTFSENDLENIEDMTECIFGKEER